MNILSDIAERYAEEVAAFKDQQARRFLEKNDIPFTTIEETNALLRKKGYRVINELEGNMMDGQKHTLLLVKIIDQTTYRINPPGFLGATTTGSDLRLEGSDASTGQE